MGKLTDTKIRNFKAEDKDRQESDGDGLSLLIKTDGKKQWIFMYSSPVHFTKDGKKQRRKTSFSYYPTVSLATAREKAREYNELIKKNIDAIDYINDTINEEKRKVNNTFENIAKMHLENIKKLNKLTEDSYKKKSDIIYNDAFPHLGDKLIENINEKDIKKTIEKRLDKKVSHSKMNNKIRTSVPTAKKLFRYINEIFKFAINEGKCKINPCYNIDLGFILPEYTEMYQAKLSDELEISKLINDIYNYKGHPSTVGALKLMLHIPLRVTNIVNLKWSSINFEKKFLIIQRKEMKSRDKKVSDFKIPLSDEVIDILNTMNHYNGHTDYVFYSNNKKQHINEDTPNIALQRMGYKNMQTAHGLRGVYRSLAETYSYKHNISDIVMEKFLDHKENNKTKAPYSSNAKYFNHFIPLVKWWSDFIIDLKNRDTK